MSSLPFISPVIVAALTNEGSERLIDAEENEASVSGGREDKTDESACVALVQRCSEFDQATITVIEWVCVEKKEEKKKKRI